MDPLLMFLQTKYKKNNVSPLILRLFSIQGLGEPISWALKLHCNHKLQFWQICFYLDKNSSEINACEQMTGYGKSFKKTGF